MACKDLSENNRAIYCRRCATKGIKALLLRALVEYRTLKIYMIKKDKIPITTQ